MCFYYFLLLFLAFVFYWNKLEQIRSWFPMKYVVFRHLINIREFVGTRTYLSSVFSDILWHSFCAQFSRERKYFLRRFKRSFSVFWFLRNESISIFTSRNGGTFAWKAIKSNTEKRFNALNITQTYRSTFIHSLQMDLPLFYQEWKAIVFCVLGEMEKIKSIANRWNESSEKHLWNCFYTSHKMRRHWTRQINLM